MARPSRIGLTFSTWHQGIVGTSLARPLFRRKVYCLVLSLTAEAEIGRVLYSYSMYIFLLLTKLLLEVD
jgi:hypothetical protein